MKPLRKILTASLILGTLFLGACSKTPEPSPKGRAATAYTLSELDEKRVKELFPDALSSPTGLRQIIRKQGKGEGTPKYGALVTLHYDLRLLDGTVLESSVQSGTPLTIPIGVGRVIKAWDQAVLEMKLGEKRTLIVPHWLGYGVTGNPPKIPPYATLVFEVELIDFHR